MSGQSKGSGYLLYHSIGLYPQKGPDMAALLSEFALGFAQSDANHWTRILPLRQEFIDLWCNLIGAPTGTLTTSENVTSSLHMLMRALPESHLKGKRVLVAADCFPSLHFLLTGLAERMEFTLHTVPIRQGERWVLEEDFIKQWDSDVGLALLTWINSTTSHKSDLSKLVAHGRHHGSLIGVDITQGVGLLPFDVNEPTVDFTVSTSLKWLCGTPGAGILYVEPEILSQCQPELRGWFSQDNPFNWNLDTFAYAPDARRFDNGTPSIVPALASLPALRWHSRQDHNALYAHTLSLSEKILSGVKELGLRVVTPENPNQRGGSIMIQLGNEINPEDILELLKRDDVTADHRDQILRFSPGIVTTSLGIDRLIESLHNALR